MKRVRAGGRPRPEARRRGGAAARREAEEALLAAGWARRQRETSWRYAIAGGLVFTAVGVLVDVLGAGTDLATLLRAAVGLVIFVGVYGLMTRTLALQREQGTREHFRLVTRRDPPWPPPPDPWPWARVGAAVGAVLAVGVGLLVLLG